MPEPDVAAFAAAFPLPDDAAWRRLVDKALKGAPFERLVSRTADGVLLQPLYAREPASAPLARAGAGPWRALARLDHPDAAAAAEQARADLEGGAHGLHLVFAGSPSAHGFGLPAALAAETLAGLDLAGVALELDPGPRQDVAERIADLLLAQNLDPAGADVAFGLRATGPDGAPAGDVAARARALADRGFAGPFVAVDARPVHAAGGSEAQELAFALAEGVAALRALEAGGFTLEAAREALVFRLAVDADQFASMCKLRALRRLWAQVETACGLAPRPLRLHAETAWRMATRRDPWVNVLRAATAAFAAGVGGADALTVLPHTQALGLPDAGARRLARNLQLVLIEEAHLATVADPAAGAGGFEALTAALCDKAWPLFQAIERDGLRDALTGGFAAAVAATRAARAADVARRKAPLTGVSEYPDLAEAPAAVLAPLEAEPGAWGPFAPMRLAAPFERLRDAADADVAARGARPRVLLLALGSLAASAARVGFARGLFQAGGFETPTSDPLADAAACGQAFARSGAALVCLCGADADYETLAEPAARALKAAGASRIWLAGRPGEREAPWRAAGLDGFIFAGCDAVATLEEARAAAEAL